MAPVRISGQTPGIVFAVLATLVFAIQDGISKHLATHYHVIFVTMMRFWAFGLLVLVLSARADGGVRAVARSAHPVLQFLRGSLLVLEISVIVWCFATLGLINTHVVFASFPLMVTALSVPLLGERVGWHRWLAVGAGFAGVVIILQPGREVIAAASLIPLVPTLMFACYHIITRYVSREDSTATSLFWTGIGGAATISLIGPFFWDPMRNPTDWLLMACLGVIGVFGHYFNIRALAIAEASSIQPLFFLQLVFASMIGMAVFGEVLTPAMLAGSLIIVASGMYTFWRARMRAGQARPAAGADPRRQPKGPADG